MAAARSVLWHDPSSDDSIPLEAVPMFRML